MTDSVEALVAEFEDKYPTRPRGCGVCLSSRRELVDALLARNAGPTDITRFLAEKGERVSPDIVSRHRDNHVQPAKLS